MNGRGVPKGRTGCVRCATKRKKFRLAQQLRKVGKNCILTHTQVHRTIYTRMLNTKSSSALNKHKENVNAPEFSRDNNIMQL